MARRWFAVHADDNRAVIQVVRDDGAGWILKQAGSITRAGIDDLDREAAVYAILGAVPAISAHLPRLALHDPTAHILVIERVGGMHGVDALRRQDVDPAMFGKVVGDWLVALHGTDLSALRRNPQGLLERDLPWILTPIRAEALAHYASLPEENVLRLLVDPDVQEALDSARTAWCARSIIHADAKLSNVMLGFGERMFCYGIDWATACWGDPMWDAAGVLQSALDLWLSGLTVGDTALASTDAVSSDIDPVRIQTFMRHFFARYTAGRGAALDDPQHLESVVRYLGARLFQTVFENIRLREKHVRRDVLALRLARAALLDPRSTAGELSIV